MRRMALLAILFLLLLGAAQGATIKGTVYDYNLQATEAVITINTTPEQTFALPNGTYEIIVTPGTYTLTVSKTSAQGLAEKDEATLTVTSDGSYTHDFILFQELQDIDSPDFQAPTAQAPATKKTNLALPLVTLFFLLASAFLIWLIKRTKQRLEQAGEADLEAELLLYVKEKKRTTQKDIRKEFPYAEATISLTLTAHEHKGHIEKVKKGRGNVILYKK